MSFRTVVFVLLCSVRFAPLAAQQPSSLTRAAMVAEALAHGPRLVVAGTDTLLAAAQRLTAGALPNPTLSASYTKSLPRYHVTAELPLDVLGLRNTRILSADAARAAARYRFAIDRAAIQLDADTIYTRGLAAAAHADLSRRSAAAADSVRRIAIARRDAGDASELDVQLASVSAGQAANASAGDSLVLVNALLDLQAAMGKPSGSVTIALADTLAAPPVAVSTVNSSESTLEVASASAAVESATLGVTVQRRAALPFPSVLFGFETGDPTGAEPGLLPTVGVSLPLPFLNHNRGPIAEAEAMRQRALSELALVRVETQNRIAQSLRAVAAAQSRVERDRALVGSANRMADLLVVAYREGAKPLEAVLEAQRTAREILGQYIDDVTSALIAQATLRMLTLTPTSVSTP